MHKLTAIAIKALPSGKNEDGGGLRLVERADGGGQWVTAAPATAVVERLGGLGVLSLKEAREKASHYRGLIAQDIDPISARRQLRAEAKRDRNVLRDVAHDARAAGLRHRGGPPSELQFRRL